jgi:hypothetical protein
MRTRHPVTLLVVAALVAGCHKSPPKEVALSSAFRTIPLPPNAQGLVQEGGADAMQMVFVTPAKPDSILAFYRRVLSADPFHLVNERTLGHATALYAEQDNGPPIWVTLTPNGNEGTQVTLAGAKDSTSRDSTGGTLTTADSGAKTPLPVKKP